MDYGTQIWKARRDNRLNQKDVALELGISQGTLVDIENDRVGIDEETFNRIILATEKLVAERIADAPELVIA